MRTLNHIYYSQDKLYAFIAKNRIENSNKILIQIFSGIDDKVLLKDISTSILAHLSDATLIGTTTDGEIIGDSVILESIVIVFTIFEFTTISAHKSSLLSVDESYRCGVDIASEFSKDSKCAISFVSGLSINGEEYLNGISSVNNNLIVSGGLAGDNGNFKGTLLLLNGEVYDENLDDIKAVAVTLTSDRLNIYTNYSLNWQTIGKWLKVTKSNKNRVYEIEGISAYDIYVKYLGNDITESLPSIGVEFPLIIKNADVDVARAVLVKHDDGSLSFAGNINEGDYVKFAYGNVEMILQNTRDNIKKCCTGHRIESIFIYSCMARRRLLQNKAQVEIEPLSNISTVSGFYTYGEFFSDGKNCQLLNETMTILAMSENDGEGQEWTSNELKIDKNDKGLNAVKALSHLVSVCVDEIEDLYSKNQKQNELMFHQSRLASMGEMIGNIAHQWRQPLASMSASVQNIELAYEMGKLDEDFLHKQTFTAKNSAEFMSKTIDDFRNFFKPEKEKSTFIIVDIFDQVFKILSSSLKNNDINIIYEHNQLFETEIYGYENEFTQAIMNIVSNAKDVLNERNKNNKKIWVNLDLNDNYLILDIVDNGGGVPEDILPKVFEPYFTTKEQGSGTGVGLYMTKTIIEEHMGGSIKATNDQYGAKFTIKIPIKDNI